MNGDARVAVHGARYGWESSLATDGAPASVLSVANTFRKCAAVGGRRDRRLVLHLQCERSTKKLRSDNAAFARLHSYLSHAGPPLCWLPSLDDLNQRDRERCESSTFVKLLTICAKSSGCGTSVLPGCESRRSRMRMGDGAFLSRSTAPVEHPASSLPMRHCEGFTANSSRASISSQTAEGDESVDVAALIPARINGTTSPTSFPATS